MPAARLAFQPAYGSGRRPAGQAWSAHTRGGHRRRRDQRRARRRSAQPSPRCHDPYGRRGGAVKSVAVVGASLAGLSAARALRAQGFDGELTIVGAETHRPYDRPPLSKEFLAGQIDAAALALESDDADDLRASWRLGVAAVGLDAGAGAVTLA